MAEFDWIPILEGKYLTYYQIGALIFSAIDALLALLSYILFLLLSKIEISKLSEGRNLHNSSITKWKNYSFVSIFIWLSFIPLVCSALDVLNLIQGMIGMFIIYLIGIYLFNGVATTTEQVVSEVQLQQIHSRNTQVLLSREFDQYRFIRNCLRSNKDTKKYIKISLALSILLPIFFYKTCISFYNDEIGYTSNLFGPAFNTYWARLLQLKKACPPGPPCHVYATIPEDPTTAFFLNLHTYAQVKGPVMVYYQQLFTRKPDEFNMKEAESFEYKQLQWMASRKIHSVLINNLTPNTKYLIKVKYDNQFYVNSIYKTLPSDPKTPIIMVNGGDSGYTHASHNISKLVVKYKPDIIFMGGDVAYDNNIPACSYTWDFFLSMIQQISSEVGYIVPLVLSVGNHDVGLNELSGTNISLDNTAYFKYFPQQFDRDSSGGVTGKVPPINKRRSYLHFTFGNTVYLTLDSGYIHGFDGIQKQFIRQTFTLHKGKVKFVNYHVPIYSVCQRFDKNPQRFLYALFHWVPLFDQFKVMTAFQNHVHSFKRTKPLKSNYPSQNGTVYVGDGAYGAVLSMLCKPDASMNIFQVFKNKNNVWISSIGQKQVVHIAIDSKNEKIDEFIQKVSSHM